MSHDEKLPLSVGSALERERERMVRLRVSKEMPPAKPTIDEPPFIIETAKKLYIEKEGGAHNLHTLAWSELTSARQCVYIDAAKRAMTPDQRWEYKAHKEIMEAERPEPKIITCGSCGLPEMVERSDYMKLLDYADRMRAERDAAIAELDSESLRRADSDLEVTKWRRWAEWAANKYFTTTGKTLEADDAT